MSIEHTIAEWLDSQDDGQVVETFLIRCPECGKVFEGVAVDEGFAFLNYTNHCPSCGYTITESEIERVNSD